MAFYKYFTTLISLSFLFVSFTQCQSPQLTSQDISAILNMIQGNTLTQNQNQQTTIELIRKLQQLQQQPPQRQNYQPPQNTNPAGNLLLPLAITGFDNPLTALAATSVASGNPGTHSSGNLNGYLAATAFDVGDTARNMMLLNGLRPTTNTQQNTRPTAPTAPTAPKQQQGLFGNNPLGNYVTARAFDFPDAATTMMLFPALTKPQHQQQTGSQQRPPASNNMGFDPVYFALAGF